MGRHDSTDRWWQTFGPSDWSDWAEPTGDGIEPTGIDALATLVSLRWRHQDGRREAEVELLARPMPPSVLVVGLAGPVASGKSTIASALAERLGSAPFGIDAVVVATDGFLRPNAELEAEGLALRKGFPESYDLHRLRDLHRSLREGHERISVPVYSHEVYDVAGEPVVVDRPQVLIVEGVNALQGATDGDPGPGDLADLRLYLDVDEETAAGWYCDRFVALTDEARDEPDSFYRLWSGLPEVEVRGAARDVWDGINGVNLREHIEPSRTRADIEVVAGAAHAITSLRLRPG